MSQVPDEYDWRVLCVSRGIKHPVEKKDLKDQQYYVGRCRNATVAKWHAEKSRFTYTRTKFSHTFVEDICHPEDDHIYDVFMPIREATSSEVASLKADWREALEEIENKQL